MNQFIPNYHIVNVISASHASDVYLVKKNETNEHYLLKSLKETDTSSSEGVNRRIRFRHEMDIVSSLDHPKIAKPIDTFVDSKCFSIIYPYRKGQTLARVIEDGISFNENDSVNVIFQILDALEYIHARGIVHMDINPYNVFLDDEKGVTLLDFGIAMNEEDARKIPSNRIIGTFPYLAPEQMGFTDFKIDIRTDLYCAATILFRLLSGNSPFGPYITSNSVLELLNASIKEKCSPLKR